MISILDWIGLAVRLVLGYAIALTIDHCHRILVRQEKWRHRARKVS